jgi:hypothetical protein
MSASEENCNNVSADSFLPPQYRYLTMLIMTILGTIDESSHVCVLCARRARAGLESPRLLTPLRIAETEVALTMSAASRKIQPMLAILILIIWTTRKTSGQLIFYTFHCIC